MVSPNTQDLESFGRVVEILQEPPGSIRRVIDDLGIAPALRLNGVSYFDGSQFDRIARRLRERSAATTIRPAETAHKPANMLG